MDSCKKLLFVFVSNIIHRKLKRLAASSFRDVKRMLYVHVRAQNIFVHVVHTIRLIFLFVECTESVIWNRKVFHREWRITRILMNAGMKMWNWICYFSCCIDKILRKDGSFTPGSGDAMIHSPCSLIIFLLHPRLGIANIIFMTLLRQWTGNGQ